MTRLWESLKWIQGKLKGLKRVEPEFQDVEEELPREGETKADFGIHGSGVSHGGFGRSSLQKCLDRLNQARVDAPASCHSGVDNENSSNPPQVMSPNVGKDQVHETQPHSRLLPEDESQSRVKEGRKEEDVTPKSEAAPAEVKEEPGDHESGACSRRTAKANCRVSTYCGSSPTTA